MKNPKLWWPNGLGEPALHDMKITLDAAGKSSDEKFLKFGIRKFDYFADNKPEFALAVNGVRVFMKGGNWGLDEMLKRIRLVPPLAPYAVRGMIWYQGEMNSGWQKYEKQFPFFVKHLRAAFGVTDQPLYIVQLPDFKQDHWVRIRDVQRKMSETVSNCELAVTIDGNEIDLHPRDKTKLATRLANLALAGCYGRKLLACSPAPEKAAAKGGKVRVAFKNAGDGLKLTEDAAPRTFELVEKGDKGVPVEAKLVGKNVVELTVPDEMSAPTRVRYAWSPDPDVNLVNSADLPATPFEIEL